VLLPDDAVKMKARVTTTLFRNHRGLYRDSYRAGLFGLPSAIMEYQEG